MFLWTFSIFSLYLVDFSVAKKWLLSTTWKNNAIFLLEQFNKQKILFGSCFYSRFHQSAPKRLAELLKLIFQLMLLMLPEVIMCRPRPSFPKWHFDFWTTKLYTRYIYNNFSFRIEVSTLKSAAMATIKVVGWIFKSRIYCS